MSWMRNEGTDSAVLRCGAVDSVGRCTGIDVEEEERGAGNSSVGGGGRERGERWCPSAWGGAPTTRGEGLARG